MLQQLMLLSIEVSQTGPMCDKNTQHSLYTLRLKRRDPPLLALATLSMRNAIKGRLQVVCTQTKQEHHGQPIQAELHSPCPIITIFLMDRF